METKKQEVNKNLNENKPPEQGCLGIIILIFALFLSIYCITLAFG